MATIDRDAQIMEEAAKQREHELRIAEINGNTTREHDRQETIRRQSRHEMFQWIGAISSVAAVLLTIIISVANATSEDRAKEIKFREQQKEVAEACIRAGNIWLDSNCIPAQK